MDETEGKAGDVAQVSTTLVSTLRDRIIEGLETAPPPTEEELRLFMAARPMTAGVELILDPRLVEAAEEYIEDIGDRLLVLQQLAAIVKSMPPAESERFQRDLIILYSKVGKTTPVETVTTSIKSEVKRLPGTVITAIVTAVVTIAVAYLLLVCGVPPIH